MEPNCMRCGADNDNKDPEAEMCRICAEDMQRLAQIVIEGGILWYCHQCKGDGAILSGEFAANVREQTGVAEDEACGVEFNSCHEHSTIH